MTPREEAALRPTRTVSRLLDEAVRVPGTNFRIGLDPILGIIPGIGDDVAATLSLYLVLEPYRLGTSNRTLVKMLSLVVIDVVIGSVPAVGPIFDAVWKANKWDVQMVERHVRQGRVRTVAFERV